uniref:Uncharacterized protein n=1 Tax=Rubinisphaera brasiliensis (strain ATCC 49424 / DSM 5305 / JCM 21570 / IAM 15109 / NBRC 103401 / IFAM 1448) TaxID=756272 RepID=F0SLN1_RUBBR|nr:hypothetical protein Plabr_1156 [Rubinisphaera brasiliensis DSM 5305]
MNQMFDVTATFSLQPRPASLCRWSVHLLKQFPDQIVVWRHGTKGFEFHVMRHNELSLLVKLRATG